MQCSEGRRIDGVQKDTEEHQTLCIPCINIYALHLPPENSRLPTGNTTIPETNNIIINDLLGLCDQRKSTSNSTSNHNGSAPIVQLAPLQLQLPELSLSSLLSAVLVGAIGNTRLEDLCQPRHSLVHRHLDQQCPSRSCNIQPKRSSEFGEFGFGDQVAVAGAQECGAGEDEVGEGAQGVEGWEEVLAVVQEVGGLLGCVMDWYVDGVVG